MSSRTRGLATRLGIVALCGTTWFFMARLAGFVFTHSSGSTLYSPSGDFWNVALAPQYWALAAAAGAMASIALAFIGWLILSGLILLFKWVFGRRHNELTHKQEVARRQQQERAVKDRLRRESEAKKAEMDAALAAQTDDYAI